MIRRGDTVEIRDAFGCWHSAVAVSDEEGTHDSNGRRIHDFPVVWVAPGRHRIPWPLSDVRRLG